MVVGAGVAVIVYIRGKNKASSTGATAGTADGTVTDPAGNTCSVLDPNSGYCPGSPEDIAYQQSMTGNFTDTGYGGTDTGVSTAGIPISSLPGSGGASGIATNSDWVTEALQLLPGGASSANQAALSAVLGGLTVTTAQLNIFNEAVGLVGMSPPQGYPTPIKTSDTSGQPGSGGTGGSGGSGGSGGTHYAANPPKNLRLIHNGRSGVEIAWNPVQGAAKYNVHTPGRSPLDFTTTSTTANIGNLKPGTKYTIEVWADPTPTGGPHATLSFTTSK